MRKLTLHCETVRHLNEVEMRKVAGGVGYYDIQDPGYKGGLELRTPVNESACGDCISNLPHVAQAELNYGYHVLPHRAENKGGGVALPLGGGCDPG